MGLDMYIYGVGRGRKEYILGGYEKYISDVNELAYFRSEYNLNEEIIKAFRDSVNVDILSDIDGRFHVRISFGNSEPLESCLLGYKKIRGNFYSDLNKKIMKSYIKKIQKWLRNNAKDGGRIEYYASW